MSFFTKENITFILAVIGSVGSICEFFYHFIASRKHLDFEILDFRTTYSPLQLFIYTQNRSQTSITVSCVSILHEGHEYYCEMIPKKIRSVAESCIYTPEFPLNLAPLMGYQYFLEFVGFPEKSLAPCSTIVVLIYTNRGVVRKSLTLQDKAHYWHTQ